MDQWSRTAATQGAEESMANRYVVDSEPPECRICGGGPEDGELLRPCGCSGSIAHVHRRCVAEWIRRNGSPICPICMKKYSDPALRALGVSHRCRRHCWYSLRVIRLCAVCAACLAFDVACRRSGSVGVASHELQQWKFHPPVADKRQVLGRYPRYRAVPGTRQLLPAHSLSERWHSPLVDQVVINVLTHWSVRPISVPVPFESLARIGQHGKAVTLTSLLGDWKGHVRHGDVSAGTRGLLRHPGHTRATLLRRARMALGGTLEYQPSVTLRCRPSCAACVVAVITLFAWLALGRRSLFWLLACLHVGPSFAPAPLVAFVALSAPLLLHQVHRHLARRGMLRQRPAVEADVLLIGLTLVATLCAGCSRNRQTVGSQSAQNATHTIAQATKFQRIASWTALLVIAWYAMVTVAQAPDGLRSARARATVWLYGVVLALCGSFLCLGAVAPILLLQ